jgi:hypothetical protein
MCGVMISSLFQCGSKNACGREMGTKMKLKSFHLVLYIREPIKIAGYMRECATCALAMYPSNKDLKADMAQLPRTDTGYWFFAYANQNHKACGEMG